MKNEKDYVEWASRSAANGDREKYFREREGLMRWFKTNPMSRENIEKDHNEWVESRKAAGKAATAGRDFDLKAPEFSESITITSTDDNSNEFGNPPKIWKGNVCDTEVTLSFIREGEMFKLTVGAF